MTKEKAIELLELDKKSRGECFISDAIDMAIKTLEQESCDDCVSRKALYEALYEHFHDEDAPNNITEVTLGSVRNFVKEFSSVTPTQSWILVSERLPKAFEFVNCTCHSLIDDREDWVVETVYIPQPSVSPYSDWGNIPMLNSGDCEVVAWMHRDIPEPYKAESEVKEWR